VEARRRPPREHGVVSDVILVDVAATLCGKESLMSEDLLVATAAGYDDSAQELDRAAAHLRIAAQHFRAHDVSRGCAHAFAAYVHIHVVRRQIDEHAEQHRMKALV
jgi:hypothetical protein